MSTRVFRKTYCLTLCIPKVFELKHQHFSFLLMPDVWKLFFITTFIEENKNQ